MASPIEAPWVRASRNESCKAPLPTSWGGPPSWLVHLGATVTDIEGGLGGVPNSSPPPSRGLSQHQALVMWEENQPRLLHLLSELFGSEVNGRCLFSIDLSPFPFLEPLPRMWCDLADLDRDPSLLKLSRSGVQELLQPGSRISARLIGDGRFAKAVPW